MRRSRSHTWPQQRSEIAYYDTSGALKKVHSTGFRASASRCRFGQDLAAKKRRRSVAVFPAPHQYFFPRDFSSNSLICGTDRGEAV